jgi:predicted glycogen debranching enzyme
MGPQVISFLRSEMTEKQRDSRRTQTRPATTVSFGREICSDLPVAEKREWLVTNGIGGFASGTVAGVLTRRYHGLLVASLKPPLGRTLLVSHVQELVEYDGTRYELSCCRWAGGSIAPEGHRLIESFRIEGTTPVWTFAFADAQLEKRLWMEQGANTTYVTYKMLRGSLPLNLGAKVLVNYRDYHSSTHAGGWRMDVQSVDKGLRVHAFEGAAPIFLLSAGAQAQPEHEWYRDFDLDAERFRGLDDREDHLHAGTFHAALSAGEAITIIASTEPSADLNGERAFGRQALHDEMLLDRWASANRSLASEAPGWIPQLVLAADQFVVRRPLQDDAEGKSVIAGYHWFGDWGRDTMIALPGLTLTTGRPEIAARILRTFAKFVDQGMLPNVFPDAGQTPEYNTADASLWYFEAVRQYVAATNDLDFLRELYPVLTDMIDWHLRGTRFQIHADPQDGLLYAGQPGVQLTWMDAKVGDWVVTPRVGKPVEINALWLNAVSSMTEFARLLKRPTAGHACLVKRARSGFARFWNEAAHCCFDVIDGPNGNDASIRPNQIFAVSLPETALTPERQRAVVDACARHLLTSHGLRSLSPHDPQFRGRYGGTPLERDGSYHQGTVWGWLLGPFALAHLRVYRDPIQAASFLEPISRHLNVHGLGSISEIFDGDPPFTPRGCIAQAWSVAEVLRAWTAIVAAQQELKTQSTQRRNA